MRADIELALQITTKGDPVPNIYRIASWLKTQDSSVSTQEIREALGMPGREVGSEVALGIGGLLDATQEQKEDGK